MVAAKSKRKRFKLFGTVDFANVAAVADVTGVVDDVEVAGVVGDGEEVTHIEGKMDLMPRLSGGVDIESARG